MRQLLALLIGCAGLPLKQHTVPQPSILLDNFDQAITHWVWSFVSDSGATGTLDFRENPKGYHACLNWNVTKGGNWVGAQRTIGPVPANAKGIRLRLKCSGASIVWLRLMDVQNRQYEYRLTRSLSDLNDSAWFSRTLLFNSLPDSASGSAKRILNPANLKRLMVVIEPRIVGRTVGKTGVCGPSDGTRRERA